MKRIVSAGIIVCFSISLFGCATGKGTGAIAGGAVGAGVGAAVSKHNPWLGALIGGALGAVAGAAIGNYIDEQKKNRQESIRAINYRPSQGNFVRISGTTNEPVRAKPGEVVGLRTTYYVMNPSPQAQVRIVESRIIQYNGEPVMEPLLRKVDRVQGEHTSTMKLPLPIEAQAGEYKVITTIDNGTRRDQSISEFYIEKT